MRKKKVQSESSVILYYSVGDIKSYDLMDVCGKKHLDWKFVDIRDVLFDETEKRDKLFDDIEDNHITHMPVIYIDGLIQTYYSDNAEDLYNFIIRKIDKKD